MIKREFQLQLPTIQTDARRNSFGQSPKHPPEVLRRGGEVALASVPLCLPDRPLATAAESAAWLLLLHSGASSGSSGGLVLECGAATC